ncbi:PAS domain-containing protein [Natronococcus sp. JC468]|uniref:ATP-binding protein n=1 Tax=Natronococcus sp. JC468 TaxID=1961921 RepID=UPI00143AA701|nr:ATP-binding protein [Natronococcus sp. JC468]NKE35260.1 PAS domain-containing protein [Natronococcus sp. JC468]
MAWQHTVYAYPILFATALSVALGAYAVARARRRGRSPTLFAFVAIVYAALTLAVVLSELARTGRAYYPQAALLTAAVVAPIGASFLAVAGVPPFGREGVNLVPAAAGLPVAALGVATFRYRLLDLPPVVYTTAMRNSPDGVLVLDSNRRIVHSNGSVERLLGASPPFAETSASAVLPEPDEPADDRTIEVATAEGDRVPDADEMLASLCYNLLTNAVVHNDGPEPEMTVVVTESDDRITVSIADDGPGFPEQPWKLLTGETPLTEYEGTGYGLYIVRSLAEGYGAELSVAHDRPTGSVVTVRLARTDDDREPEEERPVAAGIRTDTRERTSVGRSGGVAE